MKKKLVITVTLPGSEARYLDDLLARIVRQVERDGVEAQVSCQLVFVNEEHADA